MLSFILAVLVSPCRAAVEFDQGAVALPARLVSAARAFAPSAAPAQSDFSYEQFEKAFADAKTPLDSELLLGSWRHIGQALTPGRPGQILESGLNARFSRGPSILTISRVDNPLSEAAHFMMRVAPIADFWATQINEFANEFKTALTGANFVRGELAFEYEWLTAFGGSGGIRHGSSKVKGKARCRSLKGRLICAVDRPEVSFEGKARRAPTVYGLFARVGGEGLPGAPKAEVVAPK